LDTPLRTLGETIGAKEIRLGRLEGRIVDIKIYKGREKNPVKIGMCDNGITPSYQPW